MGKPSKGKKSENLGKGNVTPVQIAFIVDRYLCDNNYLVTRSLFRTEASSLIAKSPIREALKSLLSVMNTYNAGGSPAVSAPPVVASKLMLMATRLMGPLQEWCIVEWRRNDWLQSLYNARAQWVHVYFRDSFFAAVSPNQEYDGSFFGGYVNQQTTLPLFFRQYERALEN